ncbi:MAG TPA: tRNA lysidine(34) synthetase TilS [Pedobacter sp.]|jgi:tRNA(Ile)-lysidine synthase
MLPVDRFKSFIALHKLFNPSEKVLLAVSGGKDSVLMAHLFNDAGFNFGIAHCNFKLRGDESEEDEWFVEKLSLELNVSFHNTTFDTQRVALDQKISIQMAARDLRYNWFESIRNKFDYDYIALAHHQSDTTETILLNLVRGTGIAGLHGILPKRDNLIRPILFLNRQEIDSIIADCQLPFREDSSNRSTKYARNKLRLEVIPILKELNPNLEDTFEKNSLRFKELEDFLNIRIEALRNDLFQLADDGNIRIKLDDLKKLDPQMLQLYTLFKPYNFSETVLRDLTSVWDGQPGKVFESPTHRLLLDRKSLILNKIMRATDDETLIQQGETISMWNNLRLIIAERDINEVEIVGSTDQAFFDSELLQFPLKLRHWSKGDYFYPYGMKGKRKLSDFFTSLKVPLTEKNKIGILENGNGDILWVVGYRTDDRYKITAHTKNLLYSKSKYK